MAWLGNLHFTTEDLATLHADPSGGIYFADPPPEEIQAQAADLPAADVAAPFTASASVPVNPFPAGLVFHSKPGAPNVIYLNFTGETISNTEWNTQLNRSSIPAVAFSTDADLSTFSDAEQLAIRRVWQRVAEDYAPFNVDVTTERPATFTSRTAHALITRHTDANGANNPSASSGGVAYVGIFGGSSASRYRPAWIYYDNFDGAESYIAEAASHEIGHNLGLSHDGKTDSTEYYGGHGSGETSWGPIMGTGYNRNVSQWSKGEYYLANNTQDDLATIAGKLSYRTDDHGNTSGTATALGISSGGNIISTTPETDPRNTNSVNKGILERNTDTDFFSFATGPGAINLSVKPWITSGAATRGGDTDLLVELYDSAGQRLATNNPSSATAASIQTTLAEGVYYLAVKGTGVGNPASSSPSGYTTYGSIGQYFISGTVVPSGIVIPPGAELAVTDITDPGIATKQFTVTYTDDVAINVGTLNNDDIRVTGPNGYNRAATFVSVDVPSNGSPRIATYRIDPPNGSAVWSEQHEGLYSITLRTNSVRDTQDQAVPSSTLGSFNVAVPHALYIASMDSIPGWSMEGLWQFGTPAYIVSGPSSGFTGTKIVAYNLGGNYENRLSPTFATTPPINCSGASSVTLRFQRWLRLRTGDTASIEVSTNGTVWTQVWSTQSLLDSSWTPVQYTLPSWVAGSPSVRLRWGISSGQSQNDIGWNIDDVALLGDGVGDITPPTATLNAPNLVTGGSSVHSITVTYTDDTAIAVASLGATDLLVVGPNGTNTVEFGGVGTSLDGTPRTALYSITAPNGVWQITDNGEYQVFLQDGEVADSSSNFAEPALLGRFTVSIAAASPPPQLVAIDRQSGATTVTLNTSSTAPHVLEATTDLTTWIPVATNTPISGSLTFTHSAPDSRQIYRIRVSSP